MIKSKRILSKSISLNDKIKLFYSPKVEEDTTEDLANVEETPELGRVVENLTVQALREYDDGPLTPQNQSHSNEQIEGGTRKQFN